MTKWIDQHLKDPYVKQSQKEGYPSRAAYKLKQIDDKHSVFKSGMTVVDLGAAPGGWSMVAKQAVGENGQVFALDRLEMQPQLGVEFLQGDFTEETVYHDLLARLEGRSVDVVLSDMAPNLSGNKTIDQPRSMYLVELAWDFADQVLKPGGSFVAKVFQGAGVEELARQIKPSFDIMKWVKPDSSRAKSREVYLVAKSKRTSNLD